MRWPATYLAALALCGVAGGTAWYLLGHTGSSGASAAQGAWHFQDGQWVRLSPDQLAALAREQSTRAPDRVRVTGAIRLFDGSAVDGAEVVFASGDGERTARAGAQGRYQLELPPSFYRVYARADGLVAVGRVGAARVPTTPDAGDAQAQSSAIAPSLGVFRDLDNIDVEMHRAGVVTGVVRDPSGAPVAGAVVRAVSYSADNPRPIGGTDVAVTGADGGYRLLMPEGPHRLDVTHADLAGPAPSSLLHVTAQPDRETRADVSLVPGCIIRGVVVDRGGAPVSAGPIEIDVGREPPNEFAPVGLIGADGSFRVAVTEPGPVRLRAWPWKSPPTSIATVECADGTRVADLRLMVEEARPDDPAITGTLVDENGAPVTGFVDLSPLEPGGIAQQERADDHGAFAFYRVPPGRYRLSSHVDGHGVARQQIAVPSRDLRVELSGTGALTGVVEGQRGGSFTLVLEGCREPGGKRAIDSVAMPPRAFLVPLEDTSFHVGGLPACTIEARAETAFRSFRFDAEIRTDQPAMVELDLRRPSRKRLHGLVLDGDAPVAGAAIVRLPSSGTRRAPTDYAITGSDGRYALWVYTGDRVHVAAQDGREVELEIDWDDDREERATTVLPAQ